MGVLVVFGRGLGPYICGARVDLELTLYYMVGLSVGYSALVGDGVHHGLRGLLTLDVGTLLMLLFIRR